MYLLPTSYAVTKPSPLSNYLAKVGAKMVKAWQSVIFLLGVWAASQALFSSPAAAQLTPNFYAKTCPNLSQIVETNVISAILNETRMAASLLRLHFHDCFVQGCDGSILLDATATNPSEKSDRNVNQNSLRGFAVIDSIKAAVESSCPNVVSCADIVTLASLFSVVWSGGPRWNVSLGRRDAFLANANLTVNIPLSSFNTTQLKDAFAMQNLTTTDLVALSGAHTIGFARCAPITSRLYNFSGTRGTADPTINATLLTALEKSCPNGGDGNVTNSLDIQTPTVFDNLYFENLLQSDGVLNSDDELFTAANDTSFWVNVYATNQTKFFADFVNGIIKMGNLNVLTGTAGEIRQNCRVRNPVINSITVEEESSASPPVGDTTGGEHSSL